MSLDLIGKCAGFLFPVLYRPARVGFGTIIQESLVAPGVIVARYSRIYSSQLDRRVSIGHSCTLRKCRVGSYSSLGTYCRLEQVVAGRFCAIGPELSAGHGTHPTGWLSINPVFYSTRNQCGMSFAGRDYFEEAAPITIGNDVWIGARVFLRNGVRIGHGAIIGAGAVVVSDVPNYAIVGGVPAKLIRYRFPAEDIEILLQLKWWEWDEGTLAKASPLFRSGDPKALRDWWAASFQPPPSITCSMA